jgi:hypothetical protein
VPVEAESDEVAAAQRKPVVDRAVLGHVTDSPTALLDRFPADRHVARGEWQLAEQHLQQGGLTGAVGSEHGDELTGMHGEVEVVPQHAFAERQTGAGQFGDDVSTHRIDHLLACGALSS